MFQLSFFLLMIISNFWKNLSKDLKKQLYGANIDLKLQHNNNNNNNDDYTTENLLDY